MLDSYQFDIGIFVDLKIMKEMDGKFWNIEIGVYENFIDYYGYNLQMVVYVEIEWIVNK